jgi:hypothetical protein
VDGPFVSYLLVAGALARRFFDPSRQTAEIALFVEGGGSVIAPS